MRPDIPGWAPPVEWEGEDAFIIGGGSSLVDFKWHILRGRNTVGCNDAFRLGPEIVKYCLFGDASWFERCKWDLETSGITVVTNAPAMQNIKLPWLRWMKRSRDGLFKGDTLGWNYSTGAAAINLALSLGSRRIFLLGFDMSTTQGKSHWHNHRSKMTHESAYRRFIRGCECIAMSIKGYPSAEVFNVSNGTSALKVFPVVDFERFETMIEIPQFHQIPHFPPTEVHL